MTEAEIRRSTELANRLQLLLAGEDYAVAMDALCRVLMVCSVAVSADRRQARRLIGHVATHAKRGASDRWDDIRSRAVFASSTGLTS